ncbi:MAG TPA: flagellar hook-associated protein FlgL [Terriglobia bacterium]|nr:flagellar hook-associated protein FlgL [Terriglobia bacterium]
MTRITPSMQDRDFLENIYRAKGRMDQAQQEISSGKKVNNLSDDPFAAMRSSEIQANTSANDQFLSTNDQVKSRLDITDTALQSMISNLDNAKVLAAQALSGTTTPETRSALAEGVDGTIKQALSDVNMQFNGSYLFAGTKTSTVPFVESPVGSGNVTYNGNNEAIYSRLDSSTVVQTNITGQDLAQTAPSMFTTLADLKAAIQNNDTTAINARLQDLDSISERLNTLDAFVGNTTNLVNEIHSRLSDQDLALKSEDSRLTDANMVESISNFNLAEQGVNAALSAKAKVQQVSLFDFLS